MKYSMGMLISALLLAACHSAPEFMRIVHGKDLDITRTDSTYYSENILVSHPPEDTLERMKMMINYRHTTGLSLEDLKTRGDIAGYYMGFLKNTRPTRKFYLEKQVHVKCN